MTTITDDGMTDEVDWERAGGGQNHKNKNKREVINRTHDTNAARKKPMSKTLDNEKQIQKRGKKKVG